MAINAFKVRLAARRPKRIKQIDVSHASVLQVDYPFPSEAILIRNQLAKF
jgi:hypothetical protein